MTAPVPKNHSIISNRSMFKNTQPLLNVHTLNNRSFRNTSAVLVPEHFFVNKHIRHIKALSGTVVFCNIVTFYYL